MSDIVPPEFPREFMLKHCYRVLEAKEWHERLDRPLDDEDAIGYAECAFRGAGIGRECEECKLFMTRPYLWNKRDERWLPEIEGYYRRLAEWEREVQAEDEKERAATMERGSGI